MSDSRPLIRHEFGHDDPLEDLGLSRATQYVRRYLNDLDCRVVIEECVYFDHDYLAEFAAFYCKSTRGYPNHCRRLHFFSDIGIDRGVLEAAAGEDEDALKRLQDAYLGFAVVRPFTPRLLGRTVLKWYSPDPTVEGHRVTTPSRTYKIHLAGIRLEVLGLAWQPQDRAVGACATIALWSLLHSSAFDDHHAIPTTAEITEAANKQDSYGSRVYPSPGLTTYQLCEAIKAQRLAPNVIEGDGGDERNRGFKRERFLATCAAFIRSGYPVLAFGMQIEREPEGERGLHAICISGFREPKRPNPRSASDNVSLEDSDVEILYVHDDGLGPGVRCKVTSDADGVVRLTPEGPPSRNESTKYPDPSIDYPHFRPMSLIVAVHDGLVVSSDGLHQVGLKVAYAAQDIYSIATQGKPLTPRVSLQTRFVALRDYLAEELLARLGPGRALSEVRLALAEMATPMSLYLGLIRLSVNQHLLMDILFDTTDNEQYIRAFAHIRYDAMCEKLVGPIELSLGKDIGIGINASFPPAHD